LTDNIIQQEVDTQIRGEARDQAEPGHARQMTAGIEDCIIT